MIEPPRITETPQLQAAVIHLTIPRNQIQQAMGPAFGELMSTLAQQGLAPAGPAFSHHFRMDPEVFDFEVGVPVTGDVKPSGRVKPGVLPAARVARTTYQGGYEGLGSAWGEFGKWIEKEGLTTTADLWEVYAAGPESSQNPADWRTELNRPLG